jgi:hypothetical protein
VEREPSESTSISLELVGNTETCRDVCDFILENNSGHFNTAYKHWDSFLHHFQRLIDANQIMLFRKEGKLIGLCSWALTDDTKSINKMTWVLPEEISKGSTLYIDVCVLTKGASILQIKKKFEEMGYRGKVKRVLWFNMPGGHIYNKEVFR